MWAVWPLLGGLLTFAGSMAGRVLLSLGIGFVTYKGVGTSTDYLVNMIKTNMSGMPVEIVDFLAFCWVDKGLAMIFSTWTACAGSWAPAFLCCGPT